MKIEGMKTQEQTLSNKQCLYLMAHMFFGTTFFLHKDKKRFNYQSFVYWLYHEDQMIHTKLKFLMLYFKHAIQECLVDKTVRFLTFYRIASPLPQWESCANVFSEVIVDNISKIEDYAARNDSIMIDFANEYIGGGTLNWGCVQEELLFLIYPEFYVSLLLFEKMEHHEAIGLEGARRFADYSGYDFHSKFDKTNVESLESKD